MWKRVVIAAAAAGIAAGLALTAIQQASVVPLIRAAEVLEDSGLAPEHAPHAQAASPRLADTAVANIVLATGFALFLVAGLTLRGQGGWRAGAAWGAAGYVVFFAAPALGLPPELPGLLSAPLEARTQWWVLTAALTAGGLWMLAFSRPPGWRLLGIALIAAPHVLGAPHAPQVASATQDLGREFVVASALANAILWLLIGVIAGAICRGEKAVMPAAV